MASADKVTRWKAMSVAFSGNVIRRRVAVNSSAGNIIRRGIAVSIFFCQCYRVEGCGRGLFRCCYLKAGGGGGRC